MMTRQRTFVVLALLALTAGCIAWGWDPRVQAQAQVWERTTWGRVWGATAYWVGHGGVQVAVMLSLAAWAHFRQRPPTRRLALVSLAAFAASGLAALAIKFMAGRARPALADAIWNPMHLSLAGRMDSFPSGHVTTSFALAAVWAGRYPKAAPFCYGGAILVAMGRVVGGSHFPSDVAAGAALGLLVGWWLNRRLAPGGQSVSHGS